MNKRWKWKKKRGEEKVFEKDYWKEETLMKRRNGQRQVGRNTKGILNLKNKTKQKLAEKRANSSEWRRVSRERRRKDKWKRKIVKRRKGQREVKEKKTQQKW